MNLVQIVTVIAAFLAGLWTLIQIVAYSREKDPRNLKIAIVLFLLIISFVIAYPFLKQKVSPAFEPISYITYPHSYSSTGAEPVPVDTRPSPTPSIFSSPALTLDNASPTAALTSPTTEPAPSPTEVYTEALIQPPSPTPKISGQGEIKSSFIVDVKRNILGGVGDITARCTFAETGGKDVEIISYVVTVNYLDSPQDSEDKAITRSFERILANRITLKANTTSETELRFDKEIGDLALKSKKSGKVGWIKIEWIGRDEVGNTMVDSSISNRPE